MSPETKHPPFGKYSLVRELGRGGMGIVYEALDAALGRRLAIKTMILSPTADPTDAKNDGERFLREAQLLARLPKHPHIVGVYEAGVILGRRYLAMELIEGTPMSQWMLREDITLRQEVEVLRQVALAVHHAHEHDIIHRDLKPANILIDARNEPRITDFGLAKLVGHDLSVSLTGAGMVVGTPAYVSPEQAQGLKTTDRRTDVYALGVMLFEIVTGRHPFQGETPVEVMLKAAKNPVPSAAALMTVRLSGAQAKGLDDICHKAMAKKPDDRYRDAAAFAADLEKWTKGEEVKVTLPTRRAAAPNPSWTRIAQLVGALLALVLILVQLLSRPSEDPVKAEQHRQEAMKMASERRAEEERFRQEKEKLAAERLAAEDRAKKLERELEAMRAPLMKAVEVKNGPMLKPGLIAEYFSGSNFDMLLQRKIEPEIKVSWKNPAPAWPDGPIDMVTMRWRGYLRVPEKATYAFQASAVEGMRVFLDDVELLANWTSRSTMPELAVAYLDQGLHEILVEMYKTYWPTGSMWLTWKRSNDPSAAPMDASHFLYDPSGFTPVARKASPELASRKSLPGAQEAEALQILEGVPGSTSVQQMTGRGKGFLLWGKGKMGDRLVLQFDSPEAGEKMLILALARARNAGTFRIAVNGAVVAEKVDLYHPFNHFLEHEYKRVALRKGANELEFTIVGSNPQCQPMSANDTLLKLSLDYLRLQ